ncbi:tetratricopeptide repeat protein [Gemmobacter sp.]|uniref:tetratricopeptide repeat protein n=1 Tax=Gemmobacter sp. TaxID=1898957 RepID=UPI002AFF1E7A|nr:tetratricopeptide repeat protein [Gemmobacter sp.]
MRHPVILALCLGGMALAACNRNNDAEVARAMKSVNVIDESNLSDIMLTVGDPNEAVAYFTRTAADNPDRIDLQRNLGKALVRAGKAPEAAKVWEGVVARSDSNVEDKVELADALIRANDWDRAQQVLHTVPPTHETYQRYRLEAMVADANKQWKKADSFYETAQGLTNRPAGVLNNWGFSKLSRGDYAGAEKLFAEAITYDPKMFTAKNNLVMARGAQRKYDLPVVDMTQTERAELLHTMALTAIKGGDVNVGRGLLQEAVDTHPQHFDAAVRALRALDANVKRS